MGLGIASLHSVFLGDVVDAVVVLVKEFSESHSPVEKEFLGLGGAGNHLSGESRHPGEQVVSSSCAEFLGKGLRPCHLLGFVAVGEDVLDAPLADHSVSGLLVHVHVLVEVVQPCLLVELVHFESRSLGRCGMVLLSGKGRSEAEYPPVSFRNLPCEDSVPE